MITLWEYNLTGAHGVDYGRRSYHYHGIVVDFLEWYCIAGDLSVVISCASLALADAGIMMYDLITAVSVVCQCLHQLPLHYLLSLLTSLGEESNTYIEINKNTIV